MEQTIKPKALQHSFVPSRVDGLDDVGGIVIHPDRLEVNSAERLVVPKFADMARWPRPVWLSKLSHRMGARFFLPVADRDSFHPNAERFFAFYTQPKLTVYMPYDSAEDYHQSDFRKIQDVMLAGGFQSHDLG